MITTSAPPRRSRIFEIALVLSLLVHLLILLVYLGVFARIAPLLRPPVQTDEPVAVSDVIRLEKRTVPRPQVRTPPVPQRLPQPPTPQVAARRAAPPEPVQRPVAAPKPVAQHEIARTVPRAAVQPRPAPSAVAAQPQRQVALAPSAPQSRPQTNPEDAQAAQMQRYMAAISQSKSDLANIPPTHQVPSSIKQRDANMLGSTITDLQHAQGLIERHEPCDRYTAHCYFVRARIVYQDGFVELVDIPWPFIFTSRFDPIQIANGRYFTPPPPPDGYHLPHPFAPSRFVCTYFHDECKALFDAEQAAGGQPASASSSN